MIVVHVSHRALFRREQLIGTSDVDENVLRFQIDDAAKARNEMRAAERDAVKCEIRKVCEHRRFRLSREITAAVICIVRLFGAAHQHDARALQRITLLALVEHERDARIGEDVLGVDRQLRNQQNRRAVERGRDIDQRAIGVPGIRHQGRERAAAALAQELFGGELWDRRLLRGPWWSDGV